MMATRPPTHHVLQGDQPYASPVLRSPSPNASITTHYGPDKTSLADAELSPEAFQRKIEADLRIHHPREAEVAAETRPLHMPKVRRDGAGEEHAAAMFEQVMRSLRWHVAQLDEHESVERAMARAGRATLESHAAPGDVDAIMQSIMGPGAELSASSLVDAGLHSSTRGVDGHSPHWDEG